MVSTEPTTQYLHPWLQQKDNLLVTTLKTKVGPPKETDFLDIQEKISPTLPKHLETAQKDLQDLGLVFPGPCGKAISHYALHCLDCDKIGRTNAGVNAVLCRECIEESSHKGHRVYFSKREGDVAGVCDCGDPENLDPSGFCTEHRPVKVNPEEVLTKLPKYYTTEFVQEFHEAFYTRLCTQEEYLFSNKDNRFLLTQILSLAILGQIDTWKRMIEINKSFIYLFSHIFQSKLPQGKNLVYHDCDNHEEHKPVAELHECKCTILELYIRNVPSLPNKFQKNYIQLFIELSKDASFKSCLTNTFVKYFAMLAPTQSGQNNSSQNPSTGLSEFMNIPLQIFGTEEQCLLPIQNGSIVMIYDHLKKTLLSTNQLTNLLSTQFNEILSLLGYWFQQTHKKAALELVYNIGHFNHAFEILMSLCVKSPYSKQIGIPTTSGQIDDDALNMMFMAPRTIERSIEAGFRALAFETTKEGKEKFLSTVLKEWKNFFVFVQATLSNEIAPDALLSPVFERCLGLFLISTVKPFTQDSAKNFLCKYLDLKQDSELPDFVENFGRNVLNAFGKMRLLQLAHYYKSGDLHKLYLFINNLIYERDVVAIQTTALLLDQRTDIFDYCTKYFFLYSTEIKDFLQNDDKDLEEDDRIKRKIAVIEDYFMFVNHLMNDELCYFSCQLGMKTADLAEDPTFNDRYYKVIRKLLINLMGSCYWTSLKQIKEKLANYVKDCQLTERIMLEIADVKEGDFQIRLKDQYLKEYDPYFFYKIRSFQDEELHGYLNRSSGKNPDIVSGQFYTDLPQYLYDIQVKFFTSSLLASVKRVIMKVKESEAKMLGPVLHLVYQNIQLINFVQGSEKKKLLREKFVATFADQAFIEKLKSFQKVERFSEFVDCVKNILANLHKMPEFAGYSIEDEVAGLKQHQDEKGVSNLVKKEISEARWKKIQDQFAEKQKRFEEKNVEDLKETSKVIDEERKFEDETLNEKCHFCMEPFTQGNKSYGLPIYMTFTNNLAWKDIRYFNFEVTPQTMNEENYFPVMTTCGHHFHEECYETIHKKTWESGNLTKNLSKFFSHSETNCLACKSLVNNFLVLNGAPTLQFDASTRLAKLFTVIKKLDSEAATKPLASDEIDMIPLLVRRTVLYFFQSAHLLHNKREYNKQFYLIFYLLKNYYFKIQEPEIKEQLEKLGKTEFSLPKFSSFMFEYQNEQVEYMRKWDTQIDVACSALLSQVQSDPAQARNSIKKLLVREIRGRALSFLSLYPDKNFRNITEIFTYQKDIREKYLGSLLYPITSLSYLYLLLSSQDLKNNNWKTVEQSLDFLFRDPNESDEVYLNKTLQIYQEKDFTLNEILKEKALPEENADAKELAGLIGGIKRTPVDIKYAAVTRVPEKQHFFAELPDTFAEFSDWLLKRKCILCFRAQCSQHFCLCLVCGNAVCHKSCNPKKTSKIGNLTLHSWLHHARASIFIDVQELCVYVINSPEIVVYSEQLYIDEFGTSVKDVLKESSKEKLLSLDFKAFKLNKKLIRELEDMINTTYRIPQTVHSIIANSTSKVNPAAF